MARSCTNKGLAEEFLKRQIAVGLCKSRLEALAAWGASEEEWKKAKEIMDRLTLYTNSTGPR